MAGEQGPDVPLVKLITRGFIQDPYPDLRNYRERQPVIAVENGGFRMWLVTRYEDARKTLASPLMLRDFIKNRDEVVGKTMVRPERKAHIPRALRVGMLDRDGADHRRLRGLVSGYFTPSRVVELRPVIERLVDELLDGLPVGEPIDLIGHFALPATATVMADLLGLPPEGRDAYPRWVNGMLTGGSLEETESSARHLSEYTREVIRRKRAEPGADITTFLIDAAAGGMIDELELESNVGLLLIAGMEPASTIGNTVFTLLRHPDQLAAVLASPYLIPRCIEEVLRFEGPFRMLPPRYSEQPFPVGGVTIPAREFILISNAAANRDPSRFEDPDRFDVRRDTKGHLGFSHGVHRCLGAELGRLETAVAVGRLLAKFPNLTLGVPVEDIRWRPGTFMSRLYELPVVLGEKEVR
jgi:cytochrome P450